jgi:Tol biopolymer transport system component
MTKLMVMKGLAAVCWVALIAPAVWAGESVLYSVTENTVLYPATNRPVPVSVTESKTEIFALDLETGKKRLVFSDGNARLQLSAFRGGKRIIAGGRRIFAVAVDRQDLANDPRTAGALYELSTDGSGSVRKVFAIDNFSSPFVSPSGSKIGYMPGDSTETHVVIRDTATGKLLRDAVILSRTIEAEAAGGFGWMPDEKKIFFALSGGLDDEEMFWTTPNSPIGTYVMNEDAGAPQRLAPESTLHPKVGGMEPSPDVAANLIGVLADGEYLFTDSQYNPNGNQGAMYIYSLNLVKKTQRIFPSPVDGGPASFYLSPSADKLVLMVQPRVAGGHAGLRAVPTADVWVLDLGSGKQTKVLSFSDTDPTGSKGPWISLIGWLRDE